MDKIIIFCNRKDKPQLREWLIQQGVTWQSGTSLSNEYMWRMALGYSVHYIRNNVLSISTKKDYESYQSGYKDFEKIYFKPKLTIKSLLKKRKVKG